MKERTAVALNGYAALLVLAVLLVFGIVSLVTGHVPIGVILLLIFLLLASGLLVVQPNAGCAIVFFGRYLGTVKDSGIWLTIPLATRRTVTLRVRNFNSDTLKVNDSEGNPVEIAAVVVYRVVDSAKALFEVEDYEQFVEIQSETALRHVASRYPYDSMHEGAHSLRGNGEEVAAELARELQDRLAIAGVEVMEARLTHLAYAPEIAGVMLQRQQAAAIVSARERIVEGAVGMVQMAIAKLEQDGFIELDEERKANMINNLMVSITSERAAQPIINASTLY
ncbi:SPFH domain-containing protein [Alicyclobacillus shizuokensis]|uniref:SPFH domain-containing protein n=1 Tax=Alicyclobacillus shizuokensis TaxID=392014 RepID=UPI00082EA3AE|nr:SPFH domain-containing protein [Alicyclobacillus shizuokensis]MCL6626905.1 SPFH domain-containing protein [Alicyclobacillus shizuokensis]